jgi:hypothetical protein
MVLEIIELGNVADVGSNKERKILSDSWDDGAEPPKAETDPLPKFLSRDNNARGLA